VLACIPAQGTQAVSLCSSDPRKYLRISSQSGGLSKRPRLGFSLPLRIFNAVLFPIPFVPTSPSTCPGRGMGSLCSLKLLAEYRCVTCVSRFVGKLMMLMASNGHFLGQIPHPMHRRSEMKAILEVLSTSMHSLPVRTTGHDFLHSCLHFCAAVSLCGRASWGCDGPLACTVRAHLTLEKFRPRLRGSTCLVVADNRNTGARQYRATEQRYVETYRVSLSDMVAVVPRSVGVRVEGEGFARQRATLMAGHAANLRVACG
jgi:hypothetical protein